MLTMEVTLDSREEGESKFCWDCHREVPHGRVRSLSAYPDARVPQQKPIYLDGLKEVHSSTRQSDKKSGL
jgi:cytochrome c nitrite reductase small subunit